MRLLTEEARSMSSKGTAATRKAYVLIRAEGGRAEEIAQTLRRKRGVKTADVVSGSYDVIALVEGAQAEDVVRIALSEISNLNGTKHIETCLVHRTEDDATQQLED